MFHWTAINCEELLSYFDDASGVEICQRGNWFIKDEFANLDGGETENEFVKNEALGIENIN